MALQGDDPAIKVHAAKDLHLTLHYLGNTPQEDIALLGEALETAVEGVPPIEVDYRGLGAFPSLERPRVLWAGVQEPDGGTCLRDLQRAIGRALREVGYRPEKRAFHPHVTLARIHRRPTERVRTAVAAGEELDLSSESLSEVKLILSDPSQGPYHYIDLTTVDLG